MVAIFSAVPPVSGMENGSSSTLFDSLADPSATVSHFDISGKERCPRCFRYYSRLASHIERGVCITQQAALQRGSSSAVSVTVPEVSMPDLKILRKDIPLAPRVPKLSRQKLARSLSDDISECVTINKANVW